MTYLARFETHGEGLVVHGSYVRDTSKSNYSNKICNCYKKKGYIKFDFYKLQNKENLAVTNQKRKQPENSSSCQYCRIFL